MTLRRVAIRPFRLPLEHPLVSAHGRISARLGWLVELEDSAGQCGYGEATPLAEFGTENLATCEDALRRALPACLVIESEPDGSTPMVRVDGEIARATRAAPCARFAIEAARFDLAAKRAGRSLAAELRVAAGESGEGVSSVAVQALVGGEDPTTVEVNARTLTGAGFEAFKLKLAVTGHATDLGLDLERVSALRSVIGPEARVRLDANEAWNRADAAVALEALEPFAIDYVEQPVGRDDLVGLKALSEGGAIPVAADEALLGDGLAACLAAQAASILIVKPSAIGGLSNSIALRARAREDGLRIVWSTLIEGAVGRAAALALAAGLGPHDEVHGLGTAGLLAEDLAIRSADSDVEPRGRLRLSSKPGIGFEPVIPAARPSGGGAEVVLGARHARRPVFEIVA